MKLETGYPVTIGFNRRNIEYEERKSDYDVYSDFNMELTVKCERSGRNILRLTTTGGALMAALTNLGGVPATVELTESFPLFGKVKEICTLPIRQQKKETDVPPIPKKYAEAGWKYQSGYGNHHCHVMRDGVVYFKCTLVRYVDFVEDEEEQENE